MTEQDRLIVVDFIRERVVQINELMAKYPDKEDFYKGRLAEANGIIFAMEYHKIDPPDPVYEGKEVDTRDGRQTSYVRKIKWTKIESELLKKGKIKGGWKIISNKEFDKLLKSGLIKMSYE